MNISVLTLNKNRTHHLKKLIEGLNRSDTYPQELVIVEMSDEPVKFTSPNFEIKTIFLKDKKINLSKARNLAAKHATYENLLFLDVDCIPAHNFVGNMKDSLIKYNGLITCNVYYLPENFINYNTDILPSESSMLKHGEPSIYRTFNENETILGSYHTFWSLAFAVEKSIFDEIGGFSEDFIGYGGEDTEFAYRAAHNNYNHYMNGFIGAFHQYHPTQNFPYCHFLDIIQNAQTFYNKWNIWCMEGWLKTFEKDGFISWNKDKIDIIKYPNLNNVN